MEIDLPDGTIAEFPDDMNPADIEAVLSKQFGQPQTNAQPKQQAPQSIGRTVLDQAEQGATFGFGDEYMDLVGSMVAKNLPEVLGGRPDLMKDVSQRDLYNEARSNTKQRLQAQFEQNPGTSIASNIGGALLTGGAGASTATGSTIANSLRAGSTGARIAKGILAGELSGALYGAGTADDGKRGVGAAEGAVLGGAFGGAVPAIGAAASGVKNAVLPAIADSLKPLARKAVDFGIPLSRSQLGDSRFAKVLASSAAKVPFSGGGDFQKTQIQAFTKAVAKTIGEDVDNLSPSTISSAYTNIGKKFDDALGGQTIKLTDDMLDRLGQIEAEAADTVTGDHARIVKNQITSFLSDIAPDGTISGEKINSFRSKLASILSKTRNDASPFLKDLQEHIVDISVDGAPDKRALLNEARLQYKNLKTIEPLAEKAMDGQISPALLLNRVRAKYKNFARGGGGDLGDLARIGQQFLKDPIPNSGTPERLLAYGALGGAGWAEPMSAVSAILSAKGFNMANQSQALVKNALKPNVPGLLSRNAAPIALGAQGGLLMRRP